ncbi:hypothetical protein CFBP3846_P300088 (plasmid) [Pseudomonas syringae pv. avii]|uniref:Uncharacterized protein n=1 Tax=Pseudomonas syringae pv. avii TaxID=663959 RepID=A0ABY1UFP3_PSESX|nr:hypothetical protein CFBP3846_P300088 [Pseudomonas syringae pv. avii]
MNEFETQTHQESPTAPFDINAYKTACHRHCKNDPLTPT